MIGIYENFPANIHRIEVFTTPLSNKSLQKRLIHVLHEMNCRRFCFEEVSCPTVPECTIIFEAGLADEGSFNYIDEEETQKAITALRKVPFQTMDFFCAIRYYKGTEEKKKPLKFDYYMMRIIFGKNALEIRVFHERGPRYISPEDVVAFLVTKVNETSARKILIKTEST